MKRFPEYESWAKATLRRGAGHEDWQGLTLAEASARALAICEAASDGTTTGPCLALDHLQKFTEMINERYQSNV